MASDLEKRITILEQQMARLLQHSATAINSRGWVDDLFGKFAGDQAFAEAMKLGREYRTSLRPARKTRRKR